MSTPWRKALHQPRLFGSRHTETHAVTRDMFNQLRIFWYCCYRSPRSHAQSVLLRPLTYRFAKVTKLQRAGGVPRARDAGQSLRGHRANAGTA